jgi:26S proteasome regulatory subunit N3
MVQEQKADAKAAAPAEAKKEDVAVVAKPMSVKETLQGVITLLDRAVKTKDTRLMLGRLLRQTAAARRHLTGADLAAFIKTFLPESIPARAYLLQAIEKVCVVCFFGLRRVRRRGRRRLVARSLSLYLSLSLSPAPPH